MSWKAWYDNMSPAASTKAAMDDMTFYLGQKKFDELTGLLRENNLDFDQFEMWVSMTGVQGYPVKEWYYHVYGGEKASVRKVIPSQGGIQPNPTDEVVTTGGSDTEHAKPSVNEVVAFELADGGKDNLHGEGDSDTSIHPAENTREW